MRLARARTGDGIVAGEYDDGTLIAEGTEYEVASENLLAPCEPSALYCVGRNYAGTADQMDYDIPDEPHFFIKPPASVIGPGEDIPYPAFSEEVTYAGELAAVLGERCSDLDPEDVAEAVQGYTIMNDVDALDQPNLTARKAFDGSGPLGPWIETDVDPGDIDMETRIDGEVRQDASTSSMVFGPAEVIAYLSERFTFRPGDVVAFGSPPNPGLIEPGNTVEITYEGIGTLRNSVAPAGRGR